MSLGTNKSKVGAVIEVEDVWKFFDSRPVLRGVSLKIFEGDVVCIVGPNGAGKSTLLKLMIGVEKPDKGRVIIHGIDTRYTPTSRLTPLVGYVPQIPWYMFSEETVLRELMFTCINIGLPRELCESKARSIAKLFNIEHLLNESPFMLSEGQARIVAIACALVHNPKIIILDEPTSALDYVTKRKLINILRHVLDRDRAIVIATHDLELLSVLKPCRVVALNNGAKVFDGTYREFVQKLLSLDFLREALPEILEELYKLVIEYVADLDSYMIVNALIKAREHVCNKPAD